MFFVMTDVPGSRALDVVPGRHDESGRWFWSYCYADAAKNFFEDHTGVYKIRFGLNTVQMRSELADRRLQTGREAVSGCQDRRVSLGKKRSIGWPSMCLFLHFCNLLLQLVLYETQEC